MSIYDSLDICHPKEEIVWTADDIRLRKREKEKELWGVFGAKLLGPVSKGALTQFTQSGICLWGIETMNCVLFRPHYYKDF